MTNRQAIDAFCDAALESILASPAVSEARAALQQLGLTLDAIDIKVELTVERARPAPQSDEDFLRRLRIDPTLEVAPE